MRDHKDALRLTQPELKPVLKTLHSLSEGLAAEGPKVAVASFHHNEKGEHRNTRSVLVESTVCVCGAC